MENTTDNQMQGIRKSIREKGLTGEFGETEKQRITNSLLNAKTYNA
ncbi:MAG: hypothetical protein U0X40_08110 [Ferruginibacter sp.]